MKKGQREAKIKERMHEGRKKEKNKERRVE